MKSNQLFRLFVFAALLVSITPAPHTAKALPLPAPPSVDMFQWPWEQGLSWVAFDGFDNGTRRLPTSPHNYQMGGAIDFAPHNNMVNGEDTSNFWVTAAAAGTVTAKSNCHVIINHGNGWTTQYWHLDNIQVNVGAVVTRNQRLAVIANNATQVVCTGQEAPVPHLHFVMRPKMIETIFSGWKINFDIRTNITTFTKNGQTVGRNQPILNVPVSPVGTNTPTPTGTVFTSTPTLTATPVATNTTTPTGTAVFTSTPTFTASPMATDTPSPTGTSVFTNTPASTGTLAATNTPVLTDTPAPTNTLISTFTPTSSATPVFTNTPVITDTPVPTISTFTPTSTFVVTSTPTATATTITGPYVLTSANPLTLTVGNTGLATVSLNNIPVEGYTSTEFTCTYNPSLVDVSSIAVASLFGADPVSGILGPQNGSFILGIAGSNGNKAMGSGTAFTFNVSGLQIGQTTVECTARVSKGQGLLESILSISTTLTIVGITPTPTAVPTSATLTGQVLASKPVTITLYNPDSSIAASTTANPDGTFSLTAPGGTYTVVAAAPGFLSAQGPVTLVNGNTSSKPVISLIAGDIDGNSVINQLDALTIGINYNNTTPAAADLNNDGIINVLDLGILAQNYGASGALAW